MKEQTQSAIKLLEALTERAKELTCLYAIEESLKDTDADIDHVCNCIIEAIPPGWQYPDICVASITLDGKKYCSENFQETSWKLGADIIQQDQAAGSIGVFYTKDMPAADIGPFLNEEKKLVETIADRLNHFLTYKRMKHVFKEWQVKDNGTVMKRRGDWEAVMDLIRQTDNALFLRITNKMLNHLCWSGIKEAEKLRQSDVPQGMVEGRVYGEELTKHRLNRLLNFSTEFTEKIFRIAANHLSEEEILSRIQMWIQEDKLGALLRTVRQKLPLAEVSSDLRRYFFTTREKTDHRYPLARGLKALLIECVLSSRSKYINIAKDHVDIEDLYHLLRKVIFSKESHGKLGGKSAGFFLAANILKAAGNNSVGIPKTWYLTSDMMLEFIHYNNMDEIVEQKYKEIERVRVEYPHVIDMVRQTVFPQEMVNGLSMALDDFGESPLIVRSSSLLEDRTELPFSGKYKSIFLGNQGSREERLRQLMLTVAEVYASNFGPDPIEHRGEHGLIEFSEQLGIMIQEVVGERVGPYFFPLCSGIACSRNELSVLAQLDEKDGMVRMVPGLGISSRERNGSEYPVLLLPGRPASPMMENTEYCVQYAPKRIAVLNLEANAVETLELSELMKKCGAEFPDARMIMSLFKDGRLQSLPEDSVIPEDCQLIATFDGMITSSPFVMKIRELLKTLEDKIGAPVEVEFASDGERIYILQCLAKTLLRKQRPAPIPKEISRENLLFFANRYVSNGCIQNITHVIYIKPSVYQALAEERGKEDLAEAIATLNKLLPKKQFALIRPAARSGSGKDERFIDMSCDDISNAAVLVELFESDASNGNSLSLGVHFLQEIARADIHYVPIFDEEDRTCLNERFLLKAINILPDLAPDYGFLADVLKVVDVAAAANGKVMQVLMNSELGEAVGILSHPDESVGSPKEIETFDDEHPENYWRWRHRMAEQIAQQLDGAEYGVKNLYLFGSTKNGTAGPASDIDLLVHFCGTDRQREKLIKWLEGWSLCLDEVNYLRTGYRSGGLLDFHLITDEDIAKRTSYAVKINAVTDAARLLKLKR